jgi:hypothetical protein
VPRGEGSIQSFPAGGPPGAVAAAFSPAAALAAATKRRFRSSSLASGAVELINTQFSHNSTRPSSLTFAPRPVSRSRNAIFPGKMTVLRRKSLHVSWLTHRSSRFEVQSLHAAQRIRAMPCVIRLTSISFAKRSASGKRRKSALRLLALRPVFASCPGSCRLNLSHRTYPTGTSLAETVTLLEVIE